MRKGNTAEVTIDQSFDLVASPTKLERVLSKVSQPRGLDRLGFYDRYDVKSLFNLIWWGHWKRIRYKRLGFGK